MSKILVVDDRTLNRELLRTLLHYHNYDVMEASEGEEALQIARSMKPDLIITDILMPNMDGYQFVRELRQDPYLANSTVIFFTASYKNRKAMEIARSCGVEHLLFKPCEPEDILATVSQALASRSEPQIELKTAPVSVLASTSFRLTALTEICLDLSSERDPNTVLEKFCSSARELIKARFGVLLLDQEQNSCFMAQQMASELPLTMSDCRDIIPELFQGRSVFFNNQLNVLHNSLAGLRNMLGVSLRSSKETYGWLCCFDKQDGTDFDEQDQYLILTLAAQIGQTYENVMMYAKLKEQAKDLQHQNETLKKTQQALIQSEEHRRLARESAGIGTWDLNLESSFLYWDERMLELYGLKADNFANSFDDWMGRIHSDDLEMMLVGLKHQKSGQETFHNVHRAFLPDGRLRYIESTSRMLFDDRERPLHLVGIAVDITERHLAQERLKNYQSQLESLVEQLRDLAIRAEAANLAKGEFLNNISHELRTPLNGVLGMSQLLLESELDQTQRSFTEIIVESGKSLLELIDGVLEFSNIQEYNLEPELTEFSLSELLDSVFKRVEPLRARKQLKLESHSELNLPQKLIGDGTHLAQVLYHLLENAIKFTQQGWISLNLSCVNLSQSEVKMRFEVRDTGIGVASDKIEQIFEPFNQADNSLTRRFGGLGIGLSLATRLVEFMGGQIQCESRLGEGSCFWFELLFSLPAAPVVPQANKPVIQGNGPKILLVEDNPINQIVTVAILEKIGYGVTVAENGYDALNLIESENWLLVLMDCQMPVMDGYEATRRIRQAEVGQGTHLPVIAVTAHVSELDRQKCFDCGMDDYLPKPFGLDELSAMIERWIGSAMAWAD